VAARDCDPWGAAIPPKKYFAKTKKHQVFRCSEMKFYDVPDLKLRRHQVKHVLKAHSEIQPIHVLTINPKSPCIANPTTSHATLHRGDFSTFCSFKASSLQTLKITTYQ